MRGLQLLHRLHHAPPFTAFVREIEAEGDEIVSRLVDAGEKHLGSPDTRRRVPERHIHLPFHPRTIRSELNRWLASPNAKTARAAELGPGRLGEAARRE